ncbi:uncharacterized protein LOC134326938 [Trichomycterus rosablanca]|uniref:uncharacterized protein LOC134326938 n=1 Tax=Trichomycterus rosablanca TaxID=2290929 RepID=UPI002F34FC23
MGVILFGQREQMARQGLKNVNFDAFDGAVGFVNVNNSHWKFVYLHALTTQIFVVDPANNQPDMEDSMDAAQKFRTYFRTRFNKLGKKDWLNIKWKPSRINHTVQKDSTSCGVFVMQMAKETIEKFPDIPEQFNIDPKRSNIARLRKEMAQEIIVSSDSKDNYCSFCGLWTLSTMEQRSKDIVWVQCEKCMRWYHAGCMGIKNEDLPDKDTSWLCDLCKK